ncbi:hypothetical protein CC86DRAFT_411325 [Ophiobolus disseminans]|uniref:Aminoglycoside phosphotransferase domain-containing protein n=1 Tax=Ophiobolus disseminans TaxID=1469910 RepID=A0A6A6ZJZ9_9PLEO|nr:hypothetical protein CC86DRAFT_411325 [Ophiobolus disseminans]
MTHGDLGPLNILVESKDTVRISGIVDWETAGMYPEYLEYVQAFRSSGQDDWCLYLSEAAIGEVWEPAAGLVLLDAKKWLLACIDPDVRAETALVQQITCYEDIQQPRVNQDEICNYNDQLELRLTGEFGLWPELTLIRQALIPADNVQWTQADEQDVTSALRLIFRLGQTVDFRNSNNPR